MTKLLETINAYCPACNDRKDFSFKGYILECPVYRCGECDVLLNVRMMFEAINKSKGLESRTKR